MFPEAIRKLIDEFSRLPGIGPKTAEKFVWHLLRSPRRQTETLVLALTGLQQTARLCQQCFFISDQDLCVFCRDTHRDGTVVCVVAEPADVLAIERTHAFNGRYHVLGDVMDAIRGVGVDQIRSKELLARVAGDGIREIILATNPDIAGETTSLTLAKLLKPLNVAITRLARGLPMGSDLDYADEITLQSALTNRKSIG